MDRAFLDRFHEDIKPFVVVVVQVGHEGSSSSSHSKMCGWSIFHSLRKTRRKPAKADIDLLMLSGELKEDAHVQRYFQREAL